MALVGFSFVDDLSLPRGPLPIWYAKQKEYQGNRYGYHCNDEENKLKTVLCMSGVQQGKLIAMEPCSTMQDGHRKIRGGDDMGSSMC